MKQPKKAVVWPIYIDSTKTTGQGRKIRKDLCVHAPKLNELEAAASKLGLIFEVVKGSSRPNLWWEKTGHLVIEKSDVSKRDLLLELSDMIKKLRSSKF